MPPVGRCVVQTIPVTAGRRFEIVELQGRSGEEPDQRQDLRNSPAEVDRVLREPFGPPTSPSSQRVDHDGWTIPRSRLRPAGSPAAAPRATPPPRTGTR